MAVRPEGRMRAEPRRERRTGRRGADWSSGLGWGADFYRLTGRLLENAEHTSRLQRYLMVTSGYMSRIYSGGRCLRRSGHRSGSTQRGMLTIARPSSHPLLELV